jgi:hypothetical protein
MLKRMMQGLVVFAVLYSSTSERALAGPAISVSNVTDTFLGNPPFTLGWQFRVNSDISVTALGFFDNFGNGLANSYQVGIWDSAGNLIASATVDSGTTDTLMNEFRYKDISGVTLTAGQTYTIGALFLTGNDSVIFPGDATGFSSDSSITFLQSRYASGSTLSNPTTFFSTSPGFFGPNFLLEPANVPEPTTFALFGMIAAGAGYCGWRRRKAAPAA